MKIPLLRIGVLWRRFRRGRRHRTVGRLDALMRRANPFSGWNERANWMIDAAAWLQDDPGLALLDDGARQRVRRQRLRVMLDWLDAHRAVRRVVQTALQKTLREATGPELFCAIGWSDAPGLFHQFGERVTKALLPHPPLKSDLSTLLVAMFPEPADARWLMGIDRGTLARLWRLCADDGIAHACLKQVDEALLYLATTVAATGVSPAFRQRLDPGMPLQATPFMALRRELERYLMTPGCDAAAVRSVRMLIAVCQAQTDRIYAHLDEHGVALGLVHQVERMRAQLARMTLLIALREAQSQEHGQGAACVKTLLADVIDAHCGRPAAQGVVRRSFSLLARKMVERNADYGEHHAARDGDAYRAIVGAACIGGIVAAVAALGKAAILNLGLAGFFEGAFVTLVLAIAFVAISALGGVLAARQAAVTAPMLAGRMGSLDTADGLRALTAETAAVLRAQSAAAIGNLAAAAPTMLALAAAFALLSGTRMMAPQPALNALDELSLLGPTPLYAALTGVMLWLASVGASFADNWFTLHQVRAALTHHRRLVHVFGAGRSARLAAWLERHVAGIVGNLLLALLLGMTPVVAGFFGLPFQIRHLTLAAADLAAASASLGWTVVADPSFWLALAAIAVTAVLNVGVAVACAFWMSLRARDVPARLRRTAVRAVLRRLAASPAIFLLPPRAADAGATTAEAAARDGRREKRSAESRH